METEVKELPREYVFLKGHQSEYFENAPFIEPGSLLKECNDGWFQLFEPDGITKCDVTRYSPAWIEKHVDILAKLNLETKQDILDELNIERIARKELGGVGDEILFPNCSDADIFIIGFTAGYKARSKS